MCLFAKRVIWLLELIVFNDLFGLYQSSGELSHLTNKEDKEEFSDWKVFMDGC